jgi:peptidyl-prolyl cis-trans isomerase B (cyclophilin B)
MMLSYIVLTDDRCIKFGGIGLLQGGTMKYRLIFTVAVLTIAFAAIAGDNPKVVVDTSKGKIVLELYAAKAPGTVKNFLAYVDAGFYEGTIFHRVIPKFMIQGGGLSADMKKKRTQAPIRNEADNGLDNERGTIAMARTQNPHSATAQFFINTVDNNFLNHKNKSAQGWGYVVFGRVVEGMGVVDAIAKVKTVIRGGHRDVPAQAVVITKVARLP